MKRSCFVIDSKITVDKFRFLIEKFNDIIVLLPLDVPEEILISVPAIGDDLSSSHKYYNFYIIQIIFDLEYIYINIYVNMGIAEYKFLDMLFKYFYFLHLLLSIVELQYNNFILLMDDL